MKSSLSRLVLLVSLLLLCINGFAQPAAYKHYEYSDINLKFDLPDDFVFTYPYKDELGFVGTNALGSLRFLMIKQTLNTFEERRAMLYKQLGIEGEVTEDVNFQSGTTQNGYLHVSTVIDLNEYVNEVIVTLLSDPQHADFNFLLVIDFGGEENTEGPEGQQTFNILRSIGPIEK